METLPYGSGCAKVEYVLRISVRTLAIRLTIRAFTLVLSMAPPKEGDCGVEPHPTMIRVSVGIGDAVG